MRVTTWTDHDCGCSSSDTGWCVVTNTCPAHRHVIIEQGLKLNAAGKRDGKRGEQFGPFKQRLIAREDA